MEKTNTDSELDDFFTERGLRCIVNDGYRQAFLYSPEGFDWYARRRHSVGDRIKIPTSTETVENFIASYHPASPARMQIMAMDSKPDDKIIVHLISRPHPKTFVEQMRLEVRKFICTNDPRYSGIKNELRKQGKRSQIFFVSSISGVIGSQLGAGAGVVVPLVAVCLIAAIKIGREAYCREDAGS
jgi:hypothetical protein